MAVMACGQPNSAGGSPSTSEQPKAADRSKSTGPKAQTACELLSAAEVASFLKVPEAKKDDVNSGKNKLTQVDICNWYVKQGGSEGVELRLRRATSTDEGEVALVFSAAKSEAVEHDLKRSLEVQPVPGVGDEAVYAPYPVGNGGSIVFRVGSGVVSITGSPSKDTLLSMAKLAAGRV